MPIVNREKVGELHKVTVEKTFFDEVKEKVAGFLQVVGLLTVVAVSIGLFVWIN